MGNMSYCRFQNTAQDLSECVDSLDDDLSKEEQRARKQLVRLCREIVEWADARGDDE